APDLASATPPPKAIVGNFAFADTPLGRIKERFSRQRGHDERELTLPELIAARDSPSGKATIASMTAELHNRLVNILVPVMLPFLALPFALGRRRQLRAYRFAVAVAMLIAAHETIQQGALLTQKYGYSPYLTIWLPFLLICAFAGWRFWNLCFTVRSDRLEPLFDEIARLFRALRQRIFPQLANRT
ncbi:MAG: LptF/LptG family permease, partial [Aestuariivirgaceae bacterium]